MRTSVSLVRCLVLLLATAVGLPAALIPKKKAAPQPVITPKEEPKEYTLFMGTDLAIPQGKEFFRVRDVSGGNFVIKIKDKEVLVPMRAGTGTLKVNQSLKLTGVSARIDKFKADRSYTAANDPYAKFNSRSSSALGADAAANINYLHLSDALGMQSAASGALQRSLGTSQEAENRELLAAATKAADTSMDNYAEQTMANNLNSLNNPGMAALELANELAEENFDAMRYSFEVSSEYPLNRPYVVFFVRYHEKDNPNASGTSIYAKPIEPIGIRPARINLLQTGLPVGFVVDECQVRLYDNGQEIATNIAPRRVAMDRNDAFEYMLIDHLNRLKDATVGPAPALGKLNEETKSKLGIDQLKQSYYVKVSPEGRALAAFRDEACSQPVDETVAAVISDIRFFPALEKGRAVEGVVKFAFHQLTI